MANQADAVCENTTAVYLSVVICFSETIRLDWLLKTNQNINGLLFSRHSNENWNGASLSFPRITSRIPRCRPSPAPQKHCPLLCPDGPEAVSPPPEASDGVCLPSEQPALLGSHQQPPLTNTCTRQSQRVTRAQAEKCCQSSLTLFTQEDIDVGGDAQGSVGDVFQ